MKIGQNPEIANAVSQAATAAKQAKAPAAAAETAAKTAAPAAAVAAGVPVTFSNAARALDANSRASTDFDANKVKAVRAAIEKGTFTVDADAIADKLLSNAQEIISHNSNSH
ncbi:flagellar biosynthesis anti-sigma factor FlgM [Paracidovorax valerianellae]|uniref:flagellar biosynthesis anti-sigma factor FlgM n=1 Tax=Paracidovorax valerianellae TaxID=187868 RepID=UPI0023024A44|nr:flagellar biosynthesis anti-sigma factor FlgM [Paracidovorax valerianellae]MDA8447240.1 flagellar biosynthesis anti-sigma factor FlgM [Paracidovorax valerianellae]